VDPNSPTVSYVEAGRRFYVKIQDGDLPILHQLGKTVAVAIETAGGDKESAVCVPLSLESGVFLASMPTEIGKPKPGDNVLQVVGGDKITTRYVDNNSQAGQKDVVRSQTVEVVSTATLTFTMGTFEGQAPAAFVGQPLCLLLTDVDLDTSDAADKASVKVVSRYKTDDDEASAEEVKGLKADLSFQAEQKYKVRDEVVVELAELGTGAVHTGRFGAAVATAAFVDNEPVVKTDQVLTCAVGDEIVVTCVDELHIGGHSQRIARSSIMVAGEITSRLDTSVNFVADPVLRARKNIVEATAFLELARIFASMGLKKGASAKSAEGLERVDAVLKTEGPIPSSLKEEAFKIRWNLFLATEDYPRAMETCRLFNRLYPDSPFVDQAMMGIADIRMRNKEYGPAREVYSQVLRLANSMVKPEAQFRIAQAIEAEAAQRAAAAAAKRGETETAVIRPSEHAIQAYKLCAERFPESQYAGQSLGKVVDYYIEAHDYSRADDLLEQVFQDYPDGNFLDSMLIKWVDVASRMGNNQKAYDKCSQLLFEYPSSPYAGKAKELLPSLKPGAEKPGADKPAAGAGGPVKPAAGPGGPVKPE
jgi:TolA-binding protein